MIRWRGHSLLRDVQVINALDATVDLTPADELPAQLVKNRWSVNLTGQEIPLIGERNYGYEDELLD